MSELEDMTIKLLSEAFRDYDYDIERLSDRIYDLIIGTNSRVNSSYYPEDNSGNYVYMDEIENYMPEKEDWWEDDLDLLYELQTKLKDLKSKQVSDYKEEIQELPQPTSKTEFDGFDITKTDPSDDEGYLKGNKNRDYLLRKHNLSDAYIAEMTPEEYLILCGKYGWKARYDNIEDIYNSLPIREKELIHEYANMFKRGSKAPMPTIDIKNRGQEGRHRAFAAIEAGIKTMPVLIKV